jgi:hypothetical protein
VEDDLFDLAARGVEAVKTGQVFVAVGFPDKRVETGAGLVRDGPEDAVGFCPPGTEMTVQQPTDKRVTDVGVLTGLLAPSVEILTCGFHDVFGGHLAPPAGFDSA